jgi:hypothetical protein
MNLIFNILSNMGNTAKETNEVELQQFAIDWYKVVVVVPAKGTKFRTKLHTGDKECLRKIKAAYHTA